MSHTPSDPATAAAGPPRAYRNPRPLLTALAFCATLAACATGAPKQADRTAADDFVLNVQVKHAIFGDLAFKGALLDVSTYRGVVRLAGRVEREPDVARATRVASAVPGVLAVRNDISVGQP